MENKADEIGTTSVRINDSVVSLVRKHKDDTGFPIGRFIEDAILEKLDGGVIGKIRKDEELFVAWQANIAMAFKDEYARWRKKKRTLSYEDVHQIANNAAKEFLSLLIK